MQSAAQVEKKNFLKMSIVKIPYSSRFSPSQVVDNASFVNNKMSLNVNDYYIFRPVFFNESCKLLLLESAHIKRKNTTKEKTKAE